MIKITTWYRADKDYDTYRYSHFTKGHSTLLEPKSSKNTRWLKEYCFLDTSTTPSSIIRQKV